MRLTAEQFTWRKENRITGAYEIKPVNTFRKGAPRCDNCGRETEVLFDGFVASKSARAKFVLGEAIRLSMKGRAAGFGRVRRTHGRNALKATLHAFCRAEDQIRVLWEGNEQSEYYHMDFWEPVNKRDATTIAALCAPFQTTPARVCQRCRPPSNLEALEEHKAAGGRVMREYRGRRA
jgi:hypothetical protein